ncbi:MAG: hypothetical protein KC503_13120 [Myxococcales bacterium]|nr:hypothetical protein [Myxococcales bacterium]
MSRIASASSPRLLVTCAVAAALALLSLPCTARASRVKAQVALLSDCPSCPLVRRIGAELRSMSLPFEVSKVDSTPTRAQFCGLGKRGVAAGLIVRAGVQPKLFRLSGCQASLRTLPSGGDEHRVVIRAAEALRAELMSRALADERPAAPKAPAAPPPAPSISRAPSGYSPYSHRFTISASAGVLEQLGSYITAQANLRIAGRVRLWRWLELDVAMSISPERAGGSGVVFDNRYAEMYATIRPITLTAGLTACINLFWRFDLRVGLAGGFAAVSMRGYEQPQAVGDPGFSFETTLFAAVMTSHLQLGVRILGNWLWAYAGPRLGLAHSSIQASPSTEFLRWGPWFLSGMAGLEVRI